MSVANSTRWTLAYLFGSNGSSERSPPAPDQKCRLRARGIPEGLVECECEDEDLLVSLIYGLVVGTEAPTHRVVHAPVTLNAEAEPIEVPAGQPWKATVGALHGRR